MKKNLGNIILIFLVLIVSNISLDAQDFKWSAYINKNSAYTNEAVYLKYVCEFKDRGELYVVDFSPKSNDKFKIISLTQNQKIEDNKKIQTYEYVVFAKVAGKIEFEFEAIMKKTNKDSIENTVLGRDNAQFEEFTKQIIKQEKLSLDVENSGVDLVGKFDIKVKKEQDEIKAYQPYHLSVEINGIGSLEALKSLEFKNLEAEVFANEPIKKYELTQDGYKGSWSQKFAIVSDKDFKIESIKINYFDTNDKQIKFLEIESIDVKVKKAYTKVELLDEVDEEKFTFNIDIIYYILTFLAGFLIAKIRFKSEVVLSKKEKTFKEKVQNVKTLEELQMLLILQNTNKYNSIISKIENNEYSSLGEVKKLL